MTIPDELELELLEELDELLELELLLELAPLLDEAEELEFEPPLLLLPLSQADSNAKEPSNVARAK